LVQASVTVAEQQHQVGQLVTVSASDMQSAATRNLLSVERVAL